ncbi:MAG: hypothetical protein K2K71_03800 [Eubacterium sp.]|nr:hypothetical protein [Eubacterium sp.]
MACFLIDYENESGRLLEGISLLGLNKNDEIIFFYSKNASHITMELHKELERIKVKKLYIKTEPGTQNSLDFKLSSYLGACIQKNPKKKYYIVSKDCGYDCVCRFWNNKNVYVKRIEKFCYYADINKKFKAV